MHAKSVLFLFAVITVMSSCFANTGWTDVPGPPVKQSIGMFDGLIGDMQEADCRVCHDTGVPNRHHLLYGQPLPPGSLVPFSDANHDGHPDTIYGCLNCHNSTFTAMRDCTVCHTTSPHHTTSAAVSGNCGDCHGDIVDNMNDGHYIPTYSPSLVTPSASGGDGLPLNSRGNGAGACNYCHDDDGQSTPIILTTATLHHKAASNCTWCHEGQPMDFHTDEEDGFLHAPGKKKPFTNGCTDCHGADLTGGFGPSCFSCHGREWDNDSGSGHSPNFSSAVNIRKCEGCHGPDSLHHIQADSQNANNVGTVVVGGEDAGFGHVGRDAGPNDSDCWGCHGFAMSAVPDLGPVTPTLFKSDVAAILAGKAATVLLSGAAFTNTANQTLYESDVRLTAEDGTSVTLQPDVILDQGNLAVTIPAATLPGNYKLRAAKGDVASNPVVLSVIPVVTITKASGTGPVTITGRGFGGYAVGAGTTVTGTISGGRVRGAQTRTIQGTIISWSDKQIVARFREVPQTVSVHSVFGNATVRIGAR
ncbi:MAG: hypothetical protein ACYC3X_18410 [Pirellulaceae bacterium]